MKTTDKILCAAASVVLCILLSSCSQTVSETTEIQPSTAEAETVRITETEEITAPPETETEITTKPSVTETEEQTTKETTTETTAPETTETKTETETAAETEAPEYAPEFKTDLSAYEEYMNPADRDAYLILVNPENPLSETYKPSDLTLIADRREGRNDELRLYAAKALEAFMIEARANGCKRLTSVSAYRPYNTQKYIFDTDVERLMAQGYSKEEAVAIERKDTAYPGESEHQSGLAVDLLDDDSSLYDFEGTYEANWLAENCYKFGFILRYPKGKEEITTYVYESWHFRYVGRYHAKRIYDTGMCLEEYVEYLKGEQSIILA